MLGLAVSKIRIHFAQWILVHLAVAKQHLVKRLAFVSGIALKELPGPDLVGSETLGKLHGLPQIGFRFTRWVHHLVPELGAPLSIAVGTLLLHPHGRRQDQIRGLGGHCRIRIGDNNEVFRIAVAGITLLIEVGGGLQVIVDLYPIGVHHTIA